MTAPVLRETELKVPADPSAMIMARIMGRTMLTVLGWPGSVHAAVEVLGHLVDNAVEHGLAPGRTEPVEELRAWLRVTEAGELVIDVADPNTQFADFGAAAGGTLAAACGASSTMAHGSPGSPLPTSKARPCAPP
ncbi:hypothetical protein PV415_30225 [Streptomyces sp. ME03-5684b]|uniref:hypothetical protein n=1 Tax=Streptomyces sp. ME03-5684b TaxID=3028681 RepID=UPI0029ADEED3|nr:hypothetical protein [Streptomyces sp. ME03-5684b]MDX3321190.1 hypothetical protein [Streptomyces sp. ME03-5684b]